MGKGCERSPAASKGKELSEALFRVEPVCILPLCLLLSETQATCWGLASVGHLWG